MYNNGKRRNFPPARVVDEMIEARDRFGAREIYFDDDDFTVNKEGVLKLCDEIERRQVGIPRPTATCRATRPSGCAAS